MKKNLIESALNLFFPPACGFCGEITDSYLCKYCSNYLKTRQLNKINEYEDKFFTTHLWLFEYKDEVREKIIDYKFNDKSYLYRTFTQIILSDESVCNYIKEFDMIIPVPIHKKRRKSRGYNQSELIAKEIARKLKNIELKTDIIEKIKNIKPQSTLTKEQRIENVNNAYKLIKFNNDNLENKKLLLLDDVYTTGSTVNECAKMLSNSNCKRIGIITLAKD
ncbi:MAG: ComF family protein [Clostridia bacterium]|nr:ComF family protein [Clostridia bacterium]